MPKSQGFYWKIRVWMVVAVILFNVSILAEEAPEIVIQKGHSGFITAVAISRDGKYLVSGSTDNTVRLWEGSIGKEIRTFAGHTREVTSVAMSGYFLPVPCLSPLSLSVLNFLRNSWMALLRTGISKKYELS